MLFNSYLFIFAFLPVTLGIFYLLQKFNNIRLLIAWLVSASLFFYAWWNPVYLILLGGSVGVNFIIGRQIQQRLKNNIATRPLLTLGIIFNLVLLGWFKYANFFADISSIELPAVILPLAISFFTFQQIAWLIDASKGQAPEQSFLDYCLFVTFFPQLIAGPIVHHKEMMPQFADKSLFGLNAQNLAVGLTFFAIGLFKKLVIADHFALYADPVFNMADQGGTIHFIESWAAALSYSLQIYFDFSAYSEMAIGLAYMVGIQLPLNFFSPYKAANIIDFWRRWHMTLSRFLRDYLYIPLGGNRHGKTRRHVNLMTTMLLGGLWHGAGWNFIIWGGMHGAFLVINHIWQGLCRQKGIAPFASTIGRICAVTITFIAVTLSWVFFRAQSFDGAVAMYKGMFGLNGFVLSNDVFPILNISWIMFLLIAIPVLILTFAAPNTIQFMRATLRFPADHHFKQFNRHRTVLLQWRPNIFYAVITAIIAVIAILSLTKTTAFLYFQF